MKLYLQILSELDIYARVGSNTPLVLMDALAHVIDGGTLTVRFEAVIGSPIVCAICIRKAPSSGITSFLQLFLCEGDVCRVHGKQSFPSADREIKSLFCY